MYRQRRLLSSSVQMSSHVQESTYIAYIETSNRLVWAYIYKCINSITPGAHGLTINLINVNILLLTWQVSISLTNIVFFCFSFLFSPTQHVIDM